MKRTENRIRSALDLFPWARFASLAPEPLARFLEPMIRHLGLIPHAVSSRQEVEMRSVELTGHSNGRAASPLDNTGPIPVELREAPFLSDSVPWCIREAEIEKNREREKIVWTTAIVVSWAITLVVVLRLF